MIRPSIWFRMRQRQLKMGMVGTLGPASFVLFLSFISLSLPNFAGVDTLRNILTVFSLGAFIFLVPAFFVMGFLESPKPQRFCSNCGERL